MSQNQATQPSNDRSARLTDHLSLVVWLFCCVGGFVLLVHWETLPQWAAPLLLSGLLISLLIIHKQAEAHTGLLTVIAVLIAVYGITTASYDAETQRFNTAWMLVNSPLNQACERPRNNENEIIGGGRKAAIDYLQKHSSLLRGADMSQGILSYVSYYVSYYLKEHSVSLQGADISHAILSFAELKNLDLNRATMCTTDLFGGDLSASSLWGGI